jgi:hypothetical protein
MISTQLPEGTTQEEKDLIARRGQLASAASGLVESFRYYNVEQTLARLKTLLEVLPGWAADNEASIPVGHPLRLVGSVALECSKR